MTIRIDKDNHEARYGVALEEGREYVVIEYKNINNGDTWYQLKSEMVGVSGNMNPAEKRFHGWRGTTNNVSKTAEGVRRIEKIVTYKNGMSKVTLSDDLRPDWE